MVLNVLLIIQECLAWIHVRGVCPWHLHRGGLESPAIVLDHQTVSHHCCKCWLFLIQISIFPKHCWFFVVFLPQAVLYIERFIVPQVSKLSGPLKNQASIKIRSLQWSRSLKQGCLQLMGIFGQWETHKSTIKWVHYCCTSQVLRNLINHYAYPFFLNHFIVVSWDLCYNP